MASSWFLFFSYYNDARSDKHQKEYVSLYLCKVLHEVWKSSDVTSA